ncbi:MAG: hypothetical protein AB1656_17015 [Candidatus Omnitrophota bacterium]
MDIFYQLFGGMLAFVYHCFDRIVINVYLSGLSHPELDDYFFHQALGIDCITKEALAKRTQDYQKWVGL